MKDSLDDFKELLANEIEEVLLYSENQLNKKNNNKKHPKDRNSLDRMALIKNNIPNVRNTKKGMLKHKELDPTKEKKESS